MNDISTLAVSTSLAAHNTTSVNEPWTSLKTAANTPAASGEICTPKWFEGLRELLAENEDLNQNDKVQLLMAVCISDGINAGPQVVGVAKCMGFNPRHAGKMLKLGTGRLWRRDGEGRYSLRT